MKNVLLFLNDIVESDKKRTECEIQDALMHDPMTFDNPSDEDETTKQCLRIRITMLAQWILLPKTLRLPLY